MGGWDESLSDGEDVDFNLRTRGSKWAITPLTAKRYRVRAKPPGFDPLRDPPQIKDMFIPTLSSRDRAVAERLLESRAAYRAGMAAYFENDFATAAANYAKAFRICPYLARSPLVGPVLYALLGKSIGASALPNGLRRALRRRRQDTRLRRYR
jgi:hypothetical protein